MAHVRDLLGDALEILSAKGFDSGRYSFAAVGGATQARVWKGASDGANGAPELLALRLTPKPAELIRRIGVLVDSVDVVVCPRTLAVERLCADGREWTVHLCTWIGTGALTDDADMRLLGAHLARLHAAMADSPVDVSDRMLSFSQHRIPAADQQLPPWYVARDIWRDRVLAYLPLQAGQIPMQPVHGDLHRGNIVTTAGAGFGFLDFDKLMFAPQVFDLAKLTATSMFRSGRRPGGEGYVRFQARRTTELIEGYESVRVLSETELGVLEGLAILLNAETARLGEVHDVKEYREDANAVASWWIRRHRRARHDPLGIRGSRQGPPVGDHDASQIPLW